MTQPSSILICPVVPLRQLPPHEVDVIRRFLFQHVRGMDGQSDQRWRRLWGRIWSAEPGEGFPIESREERSGPFHRRHRVILERLYAAQERYPNIDALHDYLKLKTWFVEWQDGKPKPRSTAFEKCSEDDIREFHGRVVDLLYRSSTQRKLFPAVPAARRQEMVDAILSEPEGATP